jgi:hypothetical protein
MISQMLLDKKQLNHLKENQKPITQNSCACSQKSLIAMENCHYDLDFLLTREKSYNSERFLLKKISIS